MMSGTSEYAILELFSYLFVFLSSLSIIYRHGPGRSISWIFIALLAVSRVVGSSYRIYTAADAAVTENTDDLISVTPFLSIMTCLLHYLYLSSKTHH
jgi:hypothetical protein